MCQFTLVAKTIRFEQQSQIGPMRSSSDNGVGVVTGNGASKAESGRSQSREYSMGNIT